MRAWEPCDCFSSCAALAGPRRPSVISPLQLCCSSRRTGAISPLAFPLDGSIWRHSNAPGCCGCNRDYQLYVLFYRLRVSVQTATDLLDHRSTVSSTLGPFVSTFLRLHLFLSASVRSPPICTHAVCIISATLAFHFFCFRPSAASSWSFTSAFSCLLD